MNKKILLVGKVHEIEPSTIMSVQQEIQNDLDSVTGERRVVFSACNPSDNEFEFTFNRTSLQNLVEEGKINSADADTITGTGLNGFIMPEPYPKAPFGSYFNTFIGIDDFIHQTGDNPRVCKVKAGILTKCKNVVKRTTCRQELPSWRFLFSPFLKNYKLFYDNNVVLLRKMTKRGIQKPSNSYLCDK